MALISDLSGWTIIAVSWRASSELSSLSGKFSLLFSLTLIWLLKRLSNKFRYSPSWTSSGKKNQAVHNTLDFYVWSLLEELILLRQQEEKQEFWFNKSFSEEYLAVANQFKWSVGNKIIFRSIETICHKKGFESASMIHFSLPQDRAIILIITSLYGDKILALSFCNIENINSASRSRYSGFRGQSTWVSFLSM